MKARRYSTAREGAKEGSQEAAEEGGEMGKEGQGSPGEGGRWKGRACEEQGRSGPREGGADDGKWRHG